MLLSLGKKITNFYFLFLFPLFFPDVIQGHPKYVQRMSKVHPKYVQMHPISGIDFVLSSFI